MKYIFLGAISIDQRELVPLRRGQNGIHFVRPIPSKGSSYATPVLIVKKWLSLLRRH